MMFHDAHLYVRANSCMESEIKSIIHRDGRRSLILSVYSLLGGSVSVCVCVHTAHEDMHGAWQKVHGKWTSKINILWVQFYERFDGAMHFCDVIRECLMRPMGWYK